MGKMISAKDVIMAGNVLIGLEFGTAGGFDLEGQSRSNALDKGLMLERLRNNPDLALELLSYDGPIVYMGEHASEFSSEGKTLGMRLSGDGVYLKGDNVYGRFLTELREDYRREISVSVVEESLLRPGQVVSDFTPEGENEGIVALLEGEGDVYVHTEPNVHQSRRFDVARDGTTGHSRRASDRDVVFHTFECPFGIDYRSPIRVSSAAEASFLYEKALRKELDWKILFSDLRSRGLVRNVTKSEEAELIRRFSSQFLWMREQLCRDGGMEGVKIVADCHLIPDASFGRSIYDPYLAPSPAHVLARYANDPELLFSRSENGVARALEESDKNEPFRFASVAGQGKVTIIIDGSDTIGGRVPATRAVRERGGRYKISFKPKDEIEADYASFSSRMKDIVSNISPDISIEFVTGTGIGLPQMVSRFVKENGGAVGDWDYTRKKSTVVSESRFNQVRMPFMDTVFPVLVGSTGSVSFLLDSNDEDSEVTFTRNDGLRSSGLVEFTVGEDRRNRRLLEKGSLAVTTGLPVIHVQENRSENEQALFLASESSVARDSLIGERSYQESLFSGNLRTDWSVEADSAVMSFVDRDSAVAVPDIALMRDAAVYVKGMAFHSVYSAFAALVMKESGVQDSLEFQSLLSGEDSVVHINGFLERHPVDAATEEQCMRNAVHLMIQASSPFADSIVATAGKDIVCMSTFGGNRLFVDLDGKGENRFGIVLSDERESLIKELEMRKAKSENDAIHIAEENARLQRRANIQRARGEKYAGGMPKSIDETADAVWLIGANRPVQLSLPDDSSSFVLWEESSKGGDALNREIASRSRLDDGDGGLIDNNFIFLYPSDILAVSGRRHVNNFPDAKDLTGLKRKNPRTGQEFTCAFGIPVKHNNDYYEFDNPFGMSSSFRQDREGSDFFNSIIAADALARTTALNQNMSLCYSVRERRLPNGDENDDLSRVFMDTIWDYPRSKEVFDRNTGKTVVEGGVRLPVEVSKRRYNRQEKRYDNVVEQKYTKSWVPNPHAAPRLRDLLKRYERILSEGADYPLNCICMPQSDYSEVSEERFISDFSMALSIANATAVARGVPMRFPLDSEGRLDLGPDVPARLRDMAERKLDSFINVVREEDLINDSLPRIERVSIFASVKNGPLKGDGTDIYVRPNDLLAAFGPYDFSDIINGRLAPIHEMAFKMEDGSLFRVTDPRLTKNMSTGDINRYLRYDRNDECRFKVTSSNPDRIPDFVVALKSYLERAKRVRIETRLVTEKDAEAMELGMAGFVNLLSSNSESLGDGVDVVASRGPVSAIDIGNRFDGTEDVSEYYGKVDARDGFAGYAQFRYILPDGSISEWNTVTDRELALDLIYSKVSRVYRSDLHIVPSEKVLNAQLTALAITDAGELFRSLSQEQKSVVVDDKVVDSLGFSSGSSGSESVLEIPEVSENLISYTVSEGSYSKRTVENATASDVDFTVMFCVDFESSGSRCTRKAAGDSLISVPLPDKGSDLLSMKTVDIAVQTIIDQLPEEYLGGDPVGLNIAGNGMVTLSRFGYVQEYLDAYMSSVVMSLLDRGVNIHSLRSGGQTGIDETVYSASVVTGIKATIHAPKDWKFRAADGKDIKGEADFKNRFVSKDMIALKHQVDSLAASSKVERQQVKNRI